MPYSILSAALERCPPLPPCVPGLQLCPMASPAPHPRLCPTPSPAPSPGTGQLQESHSAALPQSRRMDPPRYPRSAPGIPGAAPASPGAALCGCRTPLGTPPPPGPIAFSLPHPRLPQRPHSSDAQQHHPRCVPPQGSVRLCVCRRRRRCPPPPLPFMPQRPYSSSIRTQINTPPAKSPSIHPWGTLRAAPSPPARMGHSQPSIVQKGGTQPPPAPTLPPLRDDAPLPVPPPPHFAMPMDGGSGPSQWGWGRPSGGCWGVLHSDDAAGGALPGCGGLSGGALLMPIAVGGFCPRGDDWVGGSLMMLFTRVVGGGGSSKPPP